MLAINVSGGFSSDDLAKIEAAVPNGSAAGGRYAEAQLAHLDSEKRKAG